MTEIERLKNDIEPLKVSYVAKEAEVPAATINNFLRGQHTLSLPNYIRVREAVDKIAKDILGISE